MCSIKVNDADSDFVATSFCRGRKCGGKSILDKCLWCTSRAPSHLHLPDIHRNYNRHTLFPPSRYTCRANWKWPVPCVLHNTILSTQSTVQKSKESEEIFRLNSFLLSSWLKYSPHTILATVCCSKKQFQLITIKLLLLIADDVCSNKAQNWDYLPPL